MKGNLTEGNLWKKMFLFAVPLIITNLMQAVYNVVDMIIVGQFAGAAGLSAATIGGQITVVVLMIVAGLSNGASVQVARLMGEKREHDIPRVIGTTMTLFIILAIIITIVVFVFTNPLLRALNTPDESYQQAVSYLRICMIGTIFVYIYNILSGVLRGLGNSKTPMILALVSSVLNIILDLIFVGAFSMSAVGAAQATLISQIVSACLLFGYMVRKTSFIKLERSMFKMDNVYLSALVKLGLPQSIQFTLTNISYMILGGLVNVYGVYASAAAGSVSKICSFASLAAQACMAAIITMSAQNIATKQFKRALKGMGMGILYSMPLALILYFLCMFNTDGMLSLFTTDMAVIGMGIPYLRIVAISFVIESFMFCLMGLLTGAGYTHVTMICGLTSAFVVRFGLAKVLSTLTPLGFLGIAWAYPFAPIGSSLICICFILTGRWKVNRIKM